MTNVSKAMEYAATFEREAMREKLDAALGDLDHMNLIQLQEVVLKHEQQIKDLAAHLLELKQLVTPMMEFKRREWVGLTGVEVNHIFAANVGYPERMMKEVEAKLKEDNGG